MEKEEKKGLKENSTKKKKQKKWIWKRNAWSFQENGKMDTKNNVQWAKNFIKDKN